MADFHTHIACSSTLGVAYGGAACVLYEVPLATGLLAGGLCAVSGMLPDLDSDSGRPLRESVAFASVFAPMLLIDRLREFGLSSETVVVAGAAVFMAVRFGFGMFLRKFTVHRGMFHSIPAVLIAGELIFLMASGEPAVRWYKAGAVMLGYLSHLMLDEFSSVQATRLRVKRSFGTAMKFFARQKIWPNLVTYGLLALLSYTVFYEPGWTANYQQRVRTGLANSPLLNEALRAAGMDRQADTAAIAPLPLPPPSDASGDATVLEPSFRLSGPSSVADNEHWRTVDGDSSPAVIPIERPATSERAVEGWIR